MTKDVLVRISGVHQSPGENITDVDEAIELIVPGAYYYKNNKQYILYEEIGENGEITKNQLKIYDDKHVEIRKSGSLSVCMMFETGKIHPAAYQTPFGEIKIAMDTRAIEMEEEENRISIEIDYRLEVNREPLADCCIEINVWSVGYCSHPSGVPVTVSSPF